MSLRQRTQAIMNSPAIQQTQGGKQEDIEVLKLRILELESSNEIVKNLLDASKIREKRFSLLVEKYTSVISLDLELGGGQLDVNVPTPLESMKSSDFYASMLERGGWLIGLLIFQSCSSFILEANTPLLNAHPAIIYFLTMLVGAGGNAGNQAAVRVIRGIALGSLNEKTTRQFLLREFFMAFTLSWLLGAVGMFRAIISMQTTLPETLTITVALTMIVFISIVLGAVLPFLLQAMKFDPAHSSTTIQVIMDILGVLITCTVANIILYSWVGAYIMAYLGLHKQDL